MSARVAAMVALASALAAALSAPAKAEVAPSPDAWSGAIWEVYAGSVTSDYDDPESGNVTAKLKGGVFTRAESWDMIWQGPAIWTGSRTYRGQTQEISGSGSYEIEMRAPYWRSSVSYLITAPGVGSGDFPRMWSPKVASLSYEITPDSTFVPPPYPDGNAPVSLCGTSSNSNPIWRSDTNWQLTRLPDDDGDGVPQSGVLPVDLLQPCLPTEYDNCPEEFNPVQTDSDGDGKGDACELEPPEILSLGDIELEAPEGATGMNVSYQVSASDADGAVAVSCTPASGSFFAIGTTTVSCTATNAAGTTTKTFTVTVGIEGETDPPPPPPNDPYCAGIGRYTTLGLAAKDGFLGQETFTFDVAVRWCIDASGARLRGPVELNVNTGLLPEGPTVMSLALQAFLGASFQVSTGQPAAITGKQLPNGDLEVTSSAVFEGCVDLTTLAFVAVPGASKLIGSSAWKLMPDSARKAAFEKLLAAAKAIPKKAFISKLPLPLRPQGAFLYEFTMEALEEIRWGQVGSYLGSELPFTLCNPTWLPQLVTTLAKTGEVSSADLTSGLGFWDYDYFQND